jgi:hypothetical protein
VDGFAADFSTEFSLRDLKFWAEIPVDHFDLGCILVDLRVIFRTRILDRFGRNLVGFFGSQLIFGWEFGGFFRFAADFWLGIWWVFSVRS